MPTSTLSLPSLRLHPDTGCEKKREEASEKKRVEARRGHGQCCSELGDGSRKVLPWTANPGAQKHFDPEHPLAGDSKGSSLALVL